LPFQAALSRLAQGGFLLGKIMPNVGRKPPNKNHVQSVLFYRDAGWTEALSRKWLKSHDYYTDGLDETDKLLRWRQYDPDDNKFRYRQNTIEEKNGKPSIALLLAYKKGNQMILRSAIKPHKTATDTESSWDGPAVVAALPNDADVLTYVHAWKSADGDPTAKSTYKFPHHKEMGGPAIIRGVNNALARLPQADIPDGDQAGVERHLRKHRKDAGLEEQMTIRERMNIVVENMVSGARDLTDIFFKVKDRAIAMPNIYQLVYAELERQMEIDHIYRGLVDVYLDGTTIFAVIAENGLLYKSDVTLIDAGVTLSELILVVIDYKAVAQSLKTLRQADGQYRWFAFPAATAVLNRSGELDSRQLFESFVERIEGGAPYPYLTFYHVGEAIKLGLADYVAVDGYTLLMSGLWDAEALPQAVRQAIENEPDYYGISIGYFYQPETKERLQVGEGITIPVYTDGILVEVSILAEQDAACLFTGAYTEGVNRMNKKAKDELEKIVAGNPDLEAQVAELEQHVDEVNASTEGLIRREKEVQETPLVPEVAPEVVPVESAPIASPAELQLTEEAMVAIAKRAADFMAESITSEIHVADEKATQAVEILTEQIKVLTARVAELEKPLAETVQQAIQDMPRNLTNVLNVGYRPRQKNTAEQPESRAVSSEEIAQETLANLH
jgi:hypothetical protein